MLSNKRGFVLILSGFSIVLITLFFSLPVFIESLATDRLSRLGFSNIDLVIEDTGLSATRVRLDKLTFNSTGHQYRLRDSRIELTYSLNGLLSGRIDHVHIYTSKLIVMKRINSSLNQTAGSVGFPWPGAVLPFQRLSLDRMRIEYKNSNARVTLIDLQGKLYTDSIGIHGRLAVSSRQSVPVQIRLELTKTQNLVLVAEENRKSPIVSLKSAPITANNNQQKVGFSLEADLKALQEQMANWGISPGIELTSGYMLAEGQLHWPGEKLLSGKMTLSDIHLGSTAKLDMNIASVSGYADDIKLSLPLDIKLEQQVLQWHLASHASISLYPGKALRNRYTAIQEIMNAQGRQAIKVRVPQGLAGQLQLDSGFINRPTIRFDDALHITYGDEKAAFTLQMEPGRTTINLYSPIRIKSDIRYTAISRQAGWMHAKSSRLNGAAQFVLTADNLDLLLLPDNEISIRELSYNALAIPALGGKLAANVKCNIRLADAASKCTDIYVKLNLPETRINDNRILAGDSEIRVKELVESSSGWSFSAQADLSAITIKAYKHSIKLDTIQADIQASDRQLSLDIDLSAVDGLVNARIQAVHSLDTGEGQSDIQLQPIRYTARNRILNRLFDHGYLPVKISSGQLIASSNISWQPDPANKAPLQLKQATRIQLQDIGGMYLDTVFSGLNTTLDLRGIKSVYTGKPAHIRLTKLNPGLPVTDVSVDMEISTGKAGLPVISLNRFTANMLGGQLTSDHINYDLSQEENEFTIQVKQLDIEELLKLYQNTSVYGTGIVDGILPFVISGDGLKMTNGKLAARAPGGVLRYLAGETVKGMAESDKNMGLLVDAMKDFRYSVLSTNMQYTPDGLLKMYLQIEGYNPELEGGRLIHLNIKLEENILDLMRSLMLADEIGEKIGERLQKQ